MPLNLEEIHQKQRELAKRPDSPAYAHYLNRNVPQAEPHPTREAAVEALADRIHRGTGSAFGGGVSVAGEFEPYAGELEQEVARSIRERY